MLQFVGKKNTPKKKDNNSLLPKGGQTKNSCIHVTVRLSHVDSTELQMLVSCCGKGQQRAHQSPTSLMSALASRKDEPSRPLTSCRVIESQPDHRMCDLFPSRFSLIWKVPETPTLFEWRRQKMTKRFFVQKYPLKIKQQQGKRWMWTGMFVIYIYNVNQENTFEA